jgi:pyruvate kinase
VPEEDLEMLRFGESIGVDLVALSFVRTAEDVESVREHTRLPLIAKIEKPQASTPPRRSSTPPTA